MNVLHYQRVFLARGMWRGSLLLQRTHLNGNFCLSTQSRTFSIQSDDMPLRGVRVLELGQLIAGPFAGQLLGWALLAPFSNWPNHLFLCFMARQFGAEVIKVEPPKGGDPLRVWRELDVDGTSPWFRSIGRNKKSVSIDLRKPEGREWDVSLLPVRSEHQHGLLWAG